MMDFKHCLSCQVPLQETSKQEPIQEEEPIQTSTIVITEKEPTPVVATTIPPSASEANGTISLWDRMGESFSFSLQKVSKYGKIEEDKVVFTNDSVTLNRDNLDPGNKTITSKSQATITQINGRWYLVNNSELKSTFVQVSDEEQVELKDGMTILFGNTGFIFETK